MQRGTPGVLTEIKTWTITCGIDYVLWWVQWFYQSRKMPKAPKGVLQI